MTAFVALVIILIILWLAKKAFINVKSKKEENKDGK